MILTHVHVAMGSLRSTRVRTGLTTLGIIIGVTSVSLVLSLGGGVRQAISHQVSQLSESLIVIKPGHQDDVATLSALNPYATATTSSLTEHDYDTVQKSPGAGHTAPLMLLNGSVGRDKLRQNTTIIATTESFASILALRASSGQFLDPSAERDTVVLGQQLALDLLGTNRAMGQEILVKGRAHTVIGVMKATNAPLNIVGVDLDHAAFVSLDDGKSFNQGIAQIQQLIVSVPDKTQVGTVRTTIDNTIAHNHMNERDYMVLTSDDASKGANSFYNVIVGVTTTVAAISLIVGGIGIMNIMLVSVTERTREIGIRKALGATNRQIMSQFMIESLTICFVGGLIGLGLAYGLAFFVGSWLAFQPVYSWDITGIALGMAITVGVIFGIFPAVKASRKDPIEALRQYT